MAETETKSNSGILLALLIGGGLLLLSRRAKAAPAPGITESPAVKAAAIAVLVPGTVTKNNQPATTMPTLPPGTTPAVAAAVQKAFAEGTLTVGQAAAVSQLYAPLYQGVSGPDGLSSVDFGSVEAAQAALDAYNANFVGEAQTNPNNEPATEMPTLPPGTTPAVAAAVQGAYDAGTLTVGQAAAVSQLYAPMYNPPSDPIYNPPLSAEDILGGLGNQGTTAPPSLSVVDFGSEEAAQAALAAYMANFV